MRRGSRGIAVPSGSHFGLTGRRSSFIPAWSGVRPRFLADLGFLQRIVRPVAAELAAVGAADDALGAVEPHGRLDRARPETSSGR